MKAATAAAAATASHTHTTCNVCVSLFRSSTVPGCAHVCLCLSVLCVYSRFSATWLPAPHAHRHAPRAYQNFMQFTFDINNGQEIYSTQYYALVLDIFETVAEFSSSKVSVFKSIWTSKIQKKCANLVYISWLFLYTFIPFHLTQYDFEMFCVWIFYRSLILNTVCIVS